MFLHLADTPALDPEADTPPLDQRHTPPDQKQTPPIPEADTPLSPSRPLLQRTVRIRLECILVQWWVQSYAVKKNEQKNGTERVGFMLTMKLYI